MKLSLSKVLSIRAGLQNTDGYTVVLEEGGNKKPVFCLYQLGFDVNYAIAENLEIANKAYDTYIKKRNDLIKSIAKDGNAIGPNDSAEQAKFMAEDSKIMESEIDVAFKSLEKSKLQNSALPPTVITALMPIIKDK